MDDGENFLKGIDDEVRTLMIQKAMDGERDSAIYLYDEFISKADKNEAIPPDLLRFIADRLKEAMDAVEAKAIPRAMRLIRKQGDLALSDGKRGVTREFDIVVRFLELMKEQNTEMPSHVQGEVAKEFFLSEGAVIKKYRKAKNNGDLDAAMAYLDLKEEGKWLK